MKAACLLKVGLEKEHAFRSVYLEGKGQSMKILIVEDEIKIAKGIMAIIQSRDTWQCQFRYSDNGKDALKIVEEFHPDLIITDIRMHQMTGLELAEHLKEQNLCGRIIVISGYEKFEYVQKALRANVMDYLLKPIDKHQLLDLVDKVWREMPVKYASENEERSINNRFFDIDLESDAYPESLKKAILYIRRHYMEDISMQSISDELMLHPNYLSTLLNRHLKRNFSYILDYVRLQKACGLLISSPEMTVSEISYIVGYSNERRLYQAFSRRLNCTPGEFKKRLSDK